MRLTWLGVLVGLTASAACLEVGERPRQFSNDGGVPVVDAAVDAAPTPITLTHSDDPSSVTASNSVACIQQETDDNGNTVPVFHRENSYYRVFDLAALGVDRDLAIDAVSFGIESANAGAADEQAVEVKLHTLDGDFKVANLSPLASAQVLVPNQSQTVLEVAIEATAPASSMLVAEILIPSGDPDRLLFVGSNTAGQSGPTYLRAPDCDDDGNSETPTAFAEPLDLTDFFPDMHLVLTVSGIY